MGAIFQSLSRTIIAGVVVLVILLFIAAGLTGKAVNLAQHAWWLFAMRWLHITAGVMWIGLLWYFNFVQTPSMPKIPDEQKPAVSKVIAPAALYWFRHAAMATIVRRHGLAHQHHAVHPHALLHGGAATRRAVSVTECRECRRCGFPA